MSRSFWQLVKFFIVGGSVTGVHVLTALALNSFGQISPLRANFIAFLVASVVSYLGNWYWTFSKSSHHFFALPRFAALSITCFCVTQVIVYGVVEIMRQSLWIAMLPIIVVVPTLSFWLSKARIFLPRR